MRFVFLIYVSRSGSTMLANELSESTEGLVVLPEFRLLEVLLAEGERAVRRASAEGILKLFKMDHQAGSLGLEKCVLRRIAEESREGGIKEILENVVSAYMGRRGMIAETAVIKLGSAAYLSGAIMRLFPDGIFLHIYRDARGVVNSAISNERAYFKGEKMGRGDPIYMAKKWKHFLNTVEDMKRREYNVIEIRYEDLCLSKEAVVKEVLCSLGVKPGVGRRFEVAGKEESLHRLVGKAPVTERLQAWKKELKEWQGIAIEAASEPELSSRGYKRWYLEKQGLGKFAKLSYAHAAHWWYTTIYYLRRIRFYIFTVSNWQSFRNRLKLTLRKCVER